MGLIFPVWLSREEPEGIRRKRRIIVMIVCAIFVLISSMLFSAIPSMFTLDGKNENPTATWLAWGFFVFLAAALNGHLQAFFVISGPYNKGPMALGILPAWSALGQFVAMGVIKIIGDPLDQLPLLFGILNCFLSFFTAVSLCSAYFRFRTNCCDSSEYELLKEKKSEPSSKNTSSSFLKSFGTIFLRYCKEGGWITFLFSLFIWMPLYLFLSISTDWYAVTIGKTVLGSPEYEVKAIAASTPRMYQQGVQFATSLIVVAISLFLERRLNKSSTGESMSPADQRKLRFRINWVIALVATICFTGALFLAAIVVDENWAIIVFSMIGMGGTCIYSLRALQDSFLDFKRSHHSNIDSDKNDYFKTTFVDFNTSYYSLYKMAIVIGQFAVLSASNTAVKTIGYPNTLFIAASFSSVALVALIFFCCSPTCIDYSKEIQPVGKTGNDVGDRQSVIIFRPSKRHQL